MDEKELKKIIDDFYEELRVNSCSYEKIKFEELEKNFEKYHKFFDGKIEISRTKEDDLIGFILFVIIKMEGDKKRMIDIQVYWNERKGLHYRINHYYINPFDKNLIENKKEDERIKFWDQFREKIKKHIERFELQYRLQYLFIKSECEILIELSQLCVPLETEENKDILTEIVKNIDTFLESGNYHNGEYKLKFYGLFLIIWQIVHSLQLPRWDLYLIPVLDYGVAIYKTWSQSDPKLEELLKDRKSNFKEIIEIIEPFFNS